MNIILEGPDGSGKSTLARMLSAASHYPVIGGEGPAKYPGELDERIIRLNAHRRVIFDRHPAISGPIYDQFRSNAQAIDPEVMSHFHRQDNVLVYCRGSEELQHDIFDNPSGSDSPEYLSWLAHHHRLLFKSYEEWGLNCAHIIYRVGSLKTVKLLTELIS